MAIVTAITVPVFLVNEGQFGSTGTITWYDPASGETVQDVYGAENWWHHLASLSNH
ncbi:MAG: hypothetical protein R2778_13315 [Saprospiraceae bacterium]